MGYSSYPRSAVLVLGQSSIHSLLPSTHFTQVESLLRTGRLAEAEALLARGNSTSGDQEILCYLHQCLAFALMRQTRFREATAHFIKGAIDPRIPVSYFDELRPALFSESPSRNKDSDATPRRVEDHVEVEVWDGVREYMPSERSVDDIIAINLVRNYSPYLRPGAIPDSPSGSEAVDAEPSTSGSKSQSGTRTHPATIIMREGLRGEASEMVKCILVAVLGSADMWSRDVIEITSTSLALLYAHEQDTHSLLALFAPPPSTPPTSSRPASRPSSRPPSRPDSASHLRHSNGHNAYTSLPSHVRHASQTSAKSMLPVRPEILEPVLSRLELWAVLVEMWKVYGEWAKVVDILAGLAEGTRADASVVDPLEQIFAILAPVRPNNSSIPTIVVAPSLSERERASLVKKRAAWLVSKDVDRGLELLTSLQPARHRRPTGTAGRGRDKAADGEKDAHKADELDILSELRNTSTLAAKRYLEWLVVGRGLGRGGRETTEEGELFEEFAWNCLEEVLQFAGDENIGRLWRAKAASYASPPSASVATSFPPASLLKSNSLPLPLPSSPAPRSPFLSYFASTTPDSPSKRARIKTLLLLQSLKEGKKLVIDMQDKIAAGGWDKIFGLEMAILYSKIPSARITLKVLYGLGDTATAESYASSGGSTGVVGTKLGMSAAEGCGLSDWSAWFAKGNSVGMARGKEEASDSGDMLKTLLQVYMEDGDQQQTTRLLNSRAQRLDPLDVLPLVPTAWPLNTLSNYLTRSLRRAQHHAHEGQIVKAICAGQNLAVMEDTFEILREEGAIVEEAVSDGEGGEEEEGGTGKSFDEKVVLREGEVRGEVMDVIVGGGETS